MTAHVHAQLMLQYAQDAQETDKPWERWEVLFASSRNEWRPVPSHPLWNTSSSYRRKPITIKVNGFDVPEPLKEMPKNGVIWLALPQAEEFTSVYTADRLEWKLSALVRGLVHTRKDAAVAHAKAMLGIDPYSGE